MDFFFSEEMSIYIYNICAYFPVELLVINKTSFIFNIYIKYMKLMGDISNTNKSKYQLMTRAIAPNYIVSRRFGYMF